MAYLSDKFILLSICLLINFSFSFTHFSIVPLLSAICISGFRYLYPARTENTVLLVLYLFFSASNIQFLYYLPILMYDWFLPKQALLSGLLLLPILVQIFQHPLTIIIVALSFFPAVILKQKSTRSQQLQKAYQIQRDATEELNILVTQKNKELMIRQNQEIHIAILHERNRIATDIHDTVGHLLSSSLLQIGALQTINEQSTLIEPLQDIKKTLTTGLDSIRRSIHDMYKESIDLESELQKLTQAFAKCPITLTYDIASYLPDNHTFHIISIVKEAMNNIIKHSNADTAEILLREQPIFYQLIIRDNGSDIHISNEGIGLKSMRSRVQEMHGYFRCNTKNGFEIFITIPKEVRHENHHH